MTELVTGRLGPAELLGEVREIAHSLLRANYLEITVMYGVGANLSPEEMWSPIETTSSDLETLVDTAIRDGIFAPGRSDLFVKNRSKSVTFRLCHEADIHLETDECALLKVTEDRWRERGYEGFRRDAASGEWHSI